MLFDETKSQGAAGPDAATPIPEHHTTVRWALQQDARMAAHGTESGTSVPVIACQVVG